MKKIAGLILLFVMLISVSAFAEEFTFYGNVHFGDDYESVTELSNGRPETHYSSGGNKLNMTNAYDYNNISIFSLFGVEIAGIKNSGVTFAFDKNNKVYQCLYDLGSAQMDGSYSLGSEDNANSMYSATKKLLTEKYGVPDSLYLKDESVYALYSFVDILGVPFTNCVEMANSTEADILQALRCGKVSEWLVHLENGDRVLIDNFIGFSEPNGIFMKERYSYKTYILYTYIPADATKQVKEEQNNWL